MTGKYLAIIKRDLSQKINVEGILYIAQDMHDVRIVFDRDEIVLRGKVADLLDQLNPYFFVCHAYLVVNVEKISKMTEGAIAFEGGKNLFLSRNSYTKTRKFFNEYLLTLQA